MLVIGISCFAITHIIYIFECVISLASQSAISWWLSVFMPSYRFNVSSFIRNFTSLFPPIQHFYLIFPDSLFLRYESSYIMFPFLTCIGCSKHCVCRRFLQV